MRALLFTFILGIITISSTAGTILLEGNYQGKNIYVQNPFSGTGVGFCTFEVKVNGQVTTDEVNSSAFEVDLANFKLGMGEKIVIALQHEDDCRPKVLNPEVLKPKSTFETSAIKVANNTLSWTTKNESGKLPFIVEQFRWNKWIKIGEVEGKGSAAAHDYSFEVTPHSGENLFRVKQIDYTERPNISKTARNRNNTEELTLKALKVKTSLEFTGETMYEIYDAYGNIIKKGFTSTVDVANFKKGIYYVNYDNKTEQFIKK